MVVVTRSSALTRIEHILLTTAQHFEIRALPLPSRPSLPNVQLALPHGEFQDPLRFRWTEAPSTSKTQDCLARKNIQHNFILMIS